MKGRDLKISPYNACDYRCERCLETDICKVYQMLQKEAGLGKINGLDENEMSIMLEGVKESLQETEKMLSKMADEMGINLKEIQDIKDISNEELRRDPLYEDTHEFTMQTHNFLKNIEPQMNANTREYFDDIMWHHAVVLAKAFRALSSEHDLIEDAVNSAAVAIKSLTICIMAFEYIASRCPDTGEECRRMAACAKIIRDRLVGRFLNSMIG